MSKYLGLGVATLALVSATSVWAQPLRERADGPQPPAIAREDVTAFLEARIAALHSGLQLTPEQERLWPAFERAYRERAKLRMERMERMFAARQEGRGEGRGDGRQEGRGELRRDDPVARLQRRADALLRQGAVLKALADAAAPLWQSFDEGQKRRFAILSRSSIMGFMDRREERSGAAGFPERDGSRFDYGRDGRGFGPGGPGERDGERFGYGRERRGFGPGAPGERDSDRFGYGREGRGFEFGGPRGRDDDEFGPDRDPRRMMPRRPDRDYGRDFGREGRGQFRWWRGPGDGSGRWRTGSMMGDDDVVGTVAVGPYGDGLRFDRIDEDEDEL